MKILSMAALAASLVALSACGGSGHDAASNVAADTYNVAPDDLGNGLDLGNDVSLGNETVVDNSVNLGTENLAENSAANTQ